MLMPSSCTFNQANGDGGAGISRAMLRYLKEMGAARTADAGGSAAASAPLGPSATQHYFPDCLERAVVINAPLLFRALWTVAKRFVEPETAAKYRICGSDYAGVLDAAGIPHDALPRCCAGYGTGLVAYTAAHRSISSICGGTGSERMPLTMTRVHAAARRCTRTRTRTHSRTRTRYTRGETQGCAD